MLTATTDISGQYPISEKVRAKKNGYADIMFQGTASLNMVITRMRRRGLLGMPRLPAGLSLIARSRNKRD